MGSSRARLWASVAMTAAGAFLWGFSGTCSQYLYAHYTIAPLFICAVRSVVALAVFSAFLLVRSRGVLARIVRSPRLLGSFAMFGFGLFAAQLTYLTSVSHTNAGTATVLQMASSAFIVVVACIGARSLPRGREVAGVAAAIVGTWLVATQGDLGVLAIPPLGLLWGVLNALAVTLYVMWPKNLFKQFGSLTATGVGMIVCAALSVAAWAVSVLATPEAGAGAGQAPDVLAALVAAVPQLDAFGWLLVVGGMGVIGSFVALACYLYGVARVGSVKGGMLGAFEPLGAIVVSAAWLGTIFTPYDWAGFALMLAMLALVTLEPRKRKKDPAALSE